jgi:hypothetical protein
MTTRSAINQIAFRYRPVDSTTGVTRATAKRLAERLGVDETQAIHLACTTWPSSCCLNTRPTMAR